MTQESHGLKRVLGRTDIMTLAFGTMVGWAWVMLSGFWIKEAGVLGSLTAFGIGAILCICVGLTYAELTAALPLAGGEMVYTYRALGQGFSWFVGWAISFAYIGVAAWEGIALATAIDYIFPIPQIGYLWSVAGYSVYASWSVIGMVAALVLLLLNHFGTRTTAIFQVMTTSFLIMIGLIFIFGGITFGDTSNMVPLFTNTKGIIAVLIMVPSMFVGFDVIPQSAEEMNLPKKQIAKVFIISIIMASLWYCLIILGISFAAPPEIRTSGIVPVADAMAYSYGSGIFGKILILGGICGIMTSWNGFMVGSTRIIFAMGRAKMLPPFFGKLHYKYKTPTGAILLVGGICIIAPLLGRNALVWFVNTSAFASVLSYLMVAVSFLLLRIREPDLERPFKVKYGKFIGIVVVIFSVSFLVFYTPAGGVSLKWPNEWLLILIWAFIGIFFALWAKGSYQKVTKQERENLVFGEEYSRKEFTDE
ncbi:APC family permease [Sinanaerobacter chloroacetimidivorans]|uniref:Amino acid permease n=1 Tax=Sinanaerobacter chloroacetimidivorans TaxID=2818044 RepID=A0A8J8B1V9_9FIRM|nr:APC family permease [Sinanaerobacter chloroacetimidivorans]MBR0598091.1 amino acid permease [Sinanaerobacter chloroacetimidivorans]